MTSPTPHHRLARLTLGRALVAIVFVALVFTIWRQSDHIETLTGQNQSLREANQTPDQLYLKAKAQGRAAREIEEWRHASAEADQRTRSEEFRRIRREDRIELHRIQREELKDAGAAEDRRP